MSKNDGTVRYYSTQRPVSLGTYPSGHKVREIYNFDERFYVGSIGRRAWGWIEFEDELSEKEAADYELVKTPIEEDRPFRATAYIRVGRED